jgi:hypothetical protein
MGACQCHRAVRDTVRAQLEFWGGALADLARASSCGGWSIVIVGDKAAGAFPGRESHAIRLQRAIDPRHELSVTATGAAVPSGVQVAKIGRPPHVAFKRPA